MKRILLVDDEHHVVDWLYELLDLEPSLDVELFKAYSASGAMEHLRRTKIDVVLSDIGMPGPSGLELLESIHTGWPHCRVILLTGHRQFDHIYQAEKYPGTIYLMKTEDDDAILQAVHTQLDAVEKNLLAQESLEESCLKSRLLAQNLLFGEWARGGAIPTPAALAAHDTPIDPAGPLRLAACAANDTGPRLAERLYLLACRYMGHLYHIAQWSRSGGLTLWVLQPLYTGTLENGEAVARLTQILDDVCTALHAETKGGLAFIVDDELTGFPAVPARAEELGRLARGLTGGGTVVTTPSVLAQSPGREGAYELVNYIKRYVEQNLGGDLSLTAIAGQVCYNTSYVSRVFRREVGIKLSDYIITARIERSKQILAGENHAVNDVARMVGFDTPQYFATVFRRHTGLAPARYRTNVRTGQQNTQK